MKSKWLIASLIIVTVTGLASFKTIERRVFRKNLFKKHLVGDVYVVVDKSDYELKVYDAEGWYATYPVVFGSKDLTDKYMEGDRRTPEGTFKILSKRPHQKWHKMMMLDYPNQESWAKFNERKAKGIIPRNARIGGGIAIHGTWPHDDIVVDDFTNWTNGCVSLKNEDLDELDAILPVGSKVIIQR
jgi:murein L,D-transpeptidase YafK